ncbi:MAG: hypothetical protein ACOVSW_01560, partial [Candidatus Kapaibacteriota bacterium]
RIICAFCVCVLRKICYFSRLTNRNEKATFDDVAFQRVLITLSAMFLAGLAQKEIFNVRYQRRR